MKIGAALRSLAALVLAGLVTAVALTGLGASPGQALGGLLQGAFGNWLAFTDTLVKATPLVFCGLAVAIAFEGSLWNIGADGQLVIGALAAGALGPMLRGWPHFPAILAMLLVGAGGGALWGGIAGWLRARRDVSEVISTIMLNFTAAQILSWAVHAPLIEASRAFPESNTIAVSAQLGFYLPPSRLNFGMVLAATLAIVCYVCLFHTVGGFALRAMGRNPQAAAFFGLSAPRVTISALACSGALGGLGGAVQVAAVTHRLYETLSPGWGYEAIAVALVARLNPIAVIPAALLFGALDNGAQAMQRVTGISPVAVQVVQALVIMILLSLDSRAVKRLYEKLNLREPAETATVG